MKNQLDYSEFIERYIDGEMGDSELVWFQKELDENPGLLHELSLRKKVNHAILQDDYMHYREELEEVFETAGIEKGGVPGGKVFRMVLGSIITIVLIGAIIFINSFNNQVSSEKLFEKYYHPYEASMNFRSATTGSEADLNLAMQKYKSGDFKGALVLFEKILDSDPSRIGLNLYSGISSMEIKQYDHAGKSFSRVIDDKYNMYFEQAEWYLGLCYLVTDKNGKATDLFEKIKEQHSYYSKQAGKILRKLK